MHTSRASASPTWSGRIVATLIGLATLLFAPLAMAGETDIKLPPIEGMGRNLLLGGIVVCLAGMAFGLLVYARLRDLPVHRSMLEISNLIYETCKAYLLQQGRFLIYLWLFIAAIIVLYFWYLMSMPAGVVAIIVLFSIVGILGSYAVAWFGIRINTFANSRTAFASLEGKALPCNAIPLQAGISIGTVLISTELIIMLAILLFIPKEYAGSCFMGFAIGESLGAAALRIAGGIFTKIADIGSDLMKIVFKIKEDDARNPGVIADCTGDNAGDSVGPTADGFETYGVTGVALIVFITLAVPDLAMQSTLLVWIFVMRVGMIVTSTLSYGLNEVWSRASFTGLKKMDFEQPLTRLVWLTSVISIVMTFAVSYFLLSPEQVGNDTLWWKLSAIITCGTIAGALIPELVKVFTSVNSKHVREIITSSREGGPSLNILSGLIAGNFSAYWMGLAMLGLMAGAYGVSQMGLHQLLGFEQLTTFQVEAIFAFGLVAFGFLGMGPVTIAVDSYGPVTDNAQSVYELSQIEEIPNIGKEIKKKFGFKPDFETGKALLEENDGAGNTFKATAKPVLIGTAVVGATTLIFSTIFVLTERLTQHTEKLTLLNPPFLLGLIMGGAVIYWFTGASIQAVSTGAYRAVEFIKKNIKLETTTKASIKDSRRVVEICTQYAQKGMFNIFLVVFFSTLAFACIDSFFFIGYLISIAIFGLFQAIFMANAGGAWDNAKKIAETELNAKGTALHEATVVGDTVGDPFKDTSSVALNPIIKFTTLFGLLAVELAEKMPDSRIYLAAVFFAGSIIFVYRSFYDMRIPVADEETKPAPKKKKTGLTPAPQPVAAKAKTPAPKPVEPVAQEQEDEQDEGDEAEEEQDEEEQERKAEK